MDVALPDLKVFLDINSMKDPLSKLTRLEDRVRPENPLIVFVPGQVWFQLVTADGRPFEKCLTESVRCWRSLTIEDFRLVVLTGYKHLVYLQNTPSRALTIFENKAAFDKRDAIDGKKNPLEKDALIDNLGRSKESALIVVVPDSINSPSEFNP
jgi:hypothetical protein